MKIHDSTYKKKITVMIHRTSLTMTLFSFTLVSVSIGFLVSLPLQTTTFAQLSSSPSAAAPLTEEQVEESDLLAEFQAARQEYLSAWNNTAFSSEFDIFVAEGTVGLYGQYREHLPANVFRPGETIVLYMEPVGFGHQLITDTSLDGLNGTNNASRTMYLIDMTAEMYGTDSSGAQVFAIEDIPVGTNLISHRQMTEIPLTLTLTQEEPFPVGDYVITYVVHDHVTGQSFQIDRQITIDDDAVTGAAPLPDISSQNSMQPLLSQQQLEERSQTLQQ
jgi:hypothetical protein